ncbi:hypothetical protein GGI19_004030 [Coemansia pectinata]|uniref:AB hydrolase-1 domain-containing protein n=1 Tax=Coemansia pectinata TaxID=1052879 RepID=A0A9W8L9S2_9FUNG|nr:hypothetical protein GGI19_004030 [Coemansia pectinata]
MLGLTTKTLVSPFSPQSMSKSKHDPQLQETVNALVAEYMQMPDLQESGIIDAARVRRGRLGLGPKRREKCDLYYEVFGTGPKKLFLIMGMVGCTMYWRLQTRYFSQLDYTICVFDNCGSGKSTIASGPYKITQLANDAYLVLEHLGWSQDIHLVGVSLGGMVAQEMCLMPGATSRFASVVFVDTWHSSTMALPTAKEVRFAFKGMSALGSNPKHLIDLVFSRRWADSDFHDTFKEATAEPEGSDKRQAESHPSNRAVMTALFRAIQVDLNQHRATLDDTQPPPPELSPTASRPSELHSVSATDTASAMPFPAKQDVAAADLTTCSFDIAEPAGPAIHLSSSRLRHSRSAATMSGTNHMSHPDQPASPPKQPDTFKREVSGDLHQFMACLGHTLTPARVKSIRTLNPQTRFLVIHGEKDKVIRPASGRTLAKLLACPIVWINGAGHMPLIDAHCTFNLVLRAFTRNEKWLQQIPDRTAIIPASWDDQVRVRQWIMASHPTASIKLNISSSANGSRPNLPSLQLPSGEHSEFSSQRVSRIEQMISVGPLSRELLVIDEADAKLAGRIIPANCASPDIASPTLMSRQSTSSSNASISPPTRELVIYGALMDTSIRIRRYNPTST